MDLHVKQTQGEGNELKEKSASPSFHHSPKFQFLPPPLQHLSVRKIELDDSGRPQFPALADVSINHLLLPNDQHPTEIV